MKKKMTIKEVDDLYKKYGNLGFKVNTPYGYKAIENSDITAYNSKIIKIETSSGLVLEGSPNHRVKSSNGKFVFLKNLIPNNKIQTINGNEEIKLVEILPFREDLYDIQVEEVRQYYSNGVVSHNSVMAIDLLLFLFFNTTTKGTTAIKMFNRFRENKDEVRVKGTVMIDGVDYIIERMVTRKKKRDGINYTTRTDLSFSRIMPDGTVENLEGEQRRETDDLIKKSIGSVNDFLLTIITDANNLEDIIHTKPTEKGRILSRFIGLEVLEDKERIVKEMKSKWAKGLKSDQYTSEELKINIEEFEKSVDEKNITIKTIEKDLAVIEKDIKDSRKKKEDLLSSKIEIDSEVINLRQEDIDEEIETTLKEGKTKKENYEKTKTEFDAMEEVVYDEDVHTELIKNERQEHINKGNKESEITAIERLIKNLKEGEFCPTCGQTLKDVDHSDEIKDNEDRLVKLTEELEGIVKTLNDISEEVKKFDNIKKMSSEYDRKSLMVDKLELDLNRLRLDLKEKEDLKKRYENNINNITKNKEIDSKVLGYEAKINNLEKEEREKLTQKERLNNEVSNLKTDINKNKELIKTIKIEEEIKIIFDLYIRMIGKNGISKLIMKKVMPLINSELDRLLSDTSNFRLVVDINDKKEVEFMLEKDVEEGTVTYPINEGSGFEKTVSSLAIRCVMTKISCLPKPNLIVMDEIFGKVSEENLELVGNFFQKCSEMFPNIFIISHIPVVKDWANKIITINKTNNVSSLTLN